MSDVAFARAPLWAKILFLAIASIFVGVAWLGDAICRLFKRAHKTAKGKNHD